MARISLKIVTLSLVLFAMPAVAGQEPNADVQKILDRYRSFRADTQDLAIFQLDWVSTLKEAKEKAAKEQRPILLIVVTNSYGNMYSGHC